MRTFTIAATILAVVALVSGAPVLEDRAALNILSSTSSSSSVCTDWKSKCTSVCKASDSSAKVVAASSCGSSAKVLKRALGSMTCKCNGKDITSKVISKMFTSVSSTTTSSSSSATPTATNNVAAIPLDGTSTVSSSTSSSTKSVHTMLVAGNANASNSSSGTGSALIGGENLIPVDVGLSTSAGIVLATSTTSSGPAIAVNTQAVAVPDIVLF